MGEAGGVEESGSVSNSGSFGGAVGVEPPCGGI